MPELLTRTSSASPARNAVRAERQEVAQGGVGVVAVEERGDLVQQLEVLLLLPGAGVGPVGGDDEQGRAARAAPGTPGRRPTVRATITPIAAAPTVKGSEKPSMPISGLTSTPALGQAHDAEDAQRRGHRGGGDGHELSDPRPGLARAGRPGRGRRGPRRSAASANCATLKTSLRPRWRRWSTRAAPVPSTWASTRSDGDGEDEPGGQHEVAEPRRSATSRFHWTCTTSTSLAAKSRRPQHPRQGHAPWVLRTAARRR